MMVTGTKSSGRGTFLWRINPFEVIASIWKDVVEGSKVAVPHAVGTMKTSHDSVVDLELSVVLYPSEKRLVVKDGDEVHFLFPVSPADGPEGLYVKLIEALGMVA